VLTNLITNSVHALSDQGGKIEVVLERTHRIGDRQGQMQIPGLRPGTYARITVKDNGPGIEKGILNSVFDPFFTTKPAGRGVAWDWPWFTELSRDTEAL